MTRFKTAGGDIQLREDFFKPILRYITAPQTPVLRSLLANAMFVLLVVRDLVLPGGPD